MKIPKTILTTFAALVALCEVGYSAALVTISVDTASRNLQNLQGASLSGGNSSVNGDGVALQIGYYQGATAALPFGSGLDSDFVSLIGTGSLFGVPLTIGDQVVNGAGNGEIFADNLNVFTGINDAALPAVNTPLVMRFFNATTISGSDQFLALSNPTLWLWKTPANAPSQPLISLNLDDSGLVGRSKVGGLMAGPALVPLNVSGSNIRTQPAIVPEPSTLFLLCSTGLLALRRRPRV